jgi:uncharacterized protein YjbI with pentapeptide repeats
MPTPRDLADLPYADHLVPSQGPLEREQAYDTVHFDGVRVEDAECGSARFTECAFSSVTVTGGHFRRSKFNDVWLHTVRWVGADLAETDWLDAEVVSGAFAGLEAFSAQLRRVIFHNCKFDSVNARAATLRDVTFSDCLLREVDFAGATLTNVAFPGSTLDGVRFENATLSKADLRDAAALGITAGHDCLRGAVITSGQLLDLAPMLAHTLGLEVADR